MTEIDRDTGDRLLRDNEIRALLEDENDGVDVMDVLARHFCCVEVEDEELLTNELTDEAVRVWNLMLDDDQENDDVLGSLIYAVACRVESSAFALVANALGVRERDVEMIVHSYAEEAGTPERFLALLPEVRQRIKEGDPAYYHPTPTE